MRVELHTDPSIFATLQPEWEELLARSHSDALFMRPAWLAAWWQVFGREGALRVVTARASDGRLVGVAPLFLCPLEAMADEPLPKVSVERPTPQPAAVVKPTLVLVGGTEVSDYLDWVVERGAEAAVYPAIFQHLLAEVPGWDWLDLHALPAGSPTPEQLASLATNAGLAVATDAEDVAPCVTLSGSWEDYLATLDKKERHELRRKMRNVEQSGALSLSYTTGPETLAQDLADFMALHEASTPAKADFMRDPRMRRFFTLIAQLAAERGWLDIEFLAMDARRVAALFCFRYNGALQVYNSGLDPQAWPNLSPGIVLFGCSIRHAIETGMREYDFLRGNERYKYDLGGHDRPVRRLLVRRS